MPAPSHPSSGAEGSILLVEGYGALASAITSALKKYSPRHAIHVAGSLPAAEALALETAPDLLVIDFDPPLTGALGFFSRLRTALPEAGVLILAAGLPHEILGERKEPTALQFIEKPFQLAKFGQAVQGLLGHRRGSRQIASRGTLRHLNLSDLIPLLGLEGETQILSVIAPAEERGGEIHFVRGQIRHAAVAGLRGFDALREMFGWISSAFVAAEGDAEACHSVEGLWPEILQELLRRRPTLDPAPPRQETPSVAARPRRSSKRKASATGGKKIVVIEDTETLRLFVEEMLSTHDQSLQIETAPTGLEGLSRSVSLRPNLILLDYSLPDINGDEVCRRLLESEETRQIPVIMMSGHVAEMAATAAAYENVVFTVPKPFLSAALIDAVTAALSKPQEFRRREPPVEIPPPVSLPIPDPEPPIVLEAHNISNGKVAEATPRPSPPPPVSTSLRPSPPAPVGEPATSIQVAPERMLTPARIPNASSNVVVVSIPLEVVSMQFSPALRIRTIHARSSSTAVLLRVDPRALPTARLPEAAFEIARVDLNPRAQIQRLAVVPASSQTQGLKPLFPPGIEEPAVLPAAESGAIQLLPPPGATLLIHLLSAFDLVAVELSPTFGVASLDLRARGGRMRMIFPQEGGKTGAIFESARVVLDGSAHVAEVVLESVVS